MAINLGHNVLNNSTNRCSNGTKIRLFFALTAKAVSSSLHESFIIRKVGSYKLHLNENDEINRKKED